LFSIAFSRSGLRFAVTIDALGVFARNAFALAASCRRRRARS
jgi:hypothetical protein